MLLDVSIGCFVLSIPLKTPTKISRNMVRNVVEVGAQMSGLVVRNKQRKSRRDEVEEVFEVAALWT